MAHKPSDRPEHSPRGYEWLPDAYERDVKLHGPEARETVRQALAEGDFEALLLDTIGEQYTIPHRMWRKANLEQKVYPRFESGWIRMRLASFVGSGWVGPYVEGWIFVPEGALKKVLQERPSADQSARDTLPDPYTTGFPGRPSKLKHLIEQEFRCRVEAGEVCSRLPAEARALLDWAKIKHPKAPTPTEKTIKNNIRDLYRQYARNPAQN